MTALSSLTIFIFMNYNLTNTTRYQLDNLSKEIKGYLDQPLAAFSQVSMTLSESLAKFQAHGGTTEELFYADLGFYLKSVDTYITNNQTGLQGVNGIYAYLDNRLFHSEIYNIPSNYIIKNSTWYQNGLRNILPKYTRPYRDLITDKMVMSLCQKIADPKGLVHGVLSLDLDLEWINERLKNIHDHSGSYAILLNENNLVISHPLEDRRFLQYDKIGSEFADLLALFQYDSHFAISKIKNAYGVNSRIFLHKMSNGWTLGLVVPTFSYFGWVYLTIGIFCLFSFLLMLFVCHLVIKVNLAKKKLELESRNKTSFLTRISHEIRTPLNAITGMTELLLRTGENLPHRAKVYCDNIKLASGNLVSIINDILDYSNIDYGNINLISDKYILTSVIHDAINITRARFTNENIFLLINLDPKLPNNIFGDVLKVRQCILNMLFVSLKNLREGSVCLDISGEVEGIHLILTIAVKDTGPGLSKEDLEKLLDQDQMGDTSIEANLDGTQAGLGLTKRLCEIMGGHLEIYSSKGHGTVISMTLPQVVVSSEPIARVKNGEDMRILVFEEKLPVARSISFNLAYLRLKHELVSTIERFNAKLYNESWSHLILPANIYSELAEIIAEQSPEALVALTVKESKPMGLKKVSFLLSPVQSQSLANFLNNRSRLSPDDYKAKDLNAPITMPGARVLVVDDLETNLIVAEGLMEDYGMTIDLCRSGLEAIEMVKGNDYDLVFMDHMMPELDGIETTRLIRTLEGRRIDDLPIVALTANVIHGTKDMFLEHGFNDFLAKPIDSSRLEEILLNWISKEKQIEAPKDKPGPKAASDLSRGPEAKGPEPKGLGLAGPGLAGLTEEAGDLEAFDERLGFSLSGGKEANYRRVLKVFLTDSRKALGTLTKALERNDFEEFRLYVHSLKGATATIGAKNLSKLAGDLETAVSRDNLELIKIKAPVFLSALNGLIEKVRNYLAQRELADRLPKRLSQMDLVQELRKLSKAFEEVDTKTIGSTLSSLKESGLSDEMALDLEKISDCFFEVEYDQAVTLIKNLLIVLASNQPSGNDRGKNLLN
jgi:signal transduction histidine kinase/CheY-like chemotaxis protein